MYQKQAVITGGNGEYNNQQLNKIMLCSKSLHRFHKKRQHKKIKDKNLERQITIYRNNRQQTCRYLWVITFICYTQLHCILQQPLHVNVLQISTLKSTGT